MDGRTLMGVAIIGGGLLWYMSSRPAAEIGGTSPGYVSVVNPTGGGGDTTTGGDDDTDDDTTTETTEGSDDSSTVDPTDCSKYRKAHHRDPKVWMSGTKTDYFSDGWYRPDGIRMRGFETHKEQYFLNDTVQWELDLSVRNVSKTWCGEKWGGGDKRCWLPPSSTGGAAGNNCCLQWSVTWKDPQGRTFTDGSGTITRPAAADSDPWSVLRGTFRIPDDAASIGVWECTLTYWWVGDTWGTHEDGEVTWSGNVFRAVPEVCGEETSAAENFASDFTRPVYAPSMSHQSFMQF